jgi:hypothetical protein
MGHAGLQPGDDHDQHQGSYVEIVVTNSISRDHRGTLPNAGTTVPLAGLLAAIGLVSAGLILMGASRFNRRGRKG